MDADPRPSASGLTVSSPCPYRHPFEAVRLDALVSAVVSAVAVAHAAVPQDAAAVARVAPVAFSLALVLYEPAAAVARVAVPQDAAAVARVAPVAFSLALVLYEPAAAVAELPLVAAV